MRVGTVLMLLGGAVFIVGLAVRFVPGLFAWFGHLPGDVRIEGENSRIYIPITSMIVVSVVLTVLVNVVAVFLRDR
ncbi:MAG TPA: DUF2905 domain-containing protein [Acidimicrobiia bacterium]|nr:DUF2905 domain-containing protein [Acidimicrobiia bacterium]